MKQTLDLYFEKHENLVPMARDFFRRIFLFTGVESIDEYNLQRCINELGRFIETSDKKINGVRKKNDKIIEVDRSNPADIIGKKYKQPIYILQPIPKSSQQKSILEFFESYKNDFGLTDDDFGFNSNERKSADFVYNKVMFSRFADGCGYNQTHIAKVMRCDRTTVIHYIRRYKTKITNEDIATKPF